MRPLLELAFFLALLLIWRIWLRRRISRAQLSHWGLALVLILTAAAVARESVVLALVNAVMAWWVLFRHVLVVWAGVSDDAVRPHPGQRSSVRTPMLDMTLDHDTGEADGVVRSGGFAGRRISALSREELFALLRECEARDRQGMQVLRAHMAGLGIKAGEEARSGTNARRPTAANMSADEAHDVLGVGAGASRDDIQAAHRALMKRYHPDQGGSTYLASKINEAKDVLLRQG
jgi:hypothetical protein